MPIPAATPTRFAVLALIAGLAAGCTSVGDGLFSGDKVDYKSASVKARPLEVPPDLTQLARESRYQPQGGVVSASGAGAAAATVAPAAAAAPAVAAVAVTDVAGMRIERAGQQRWLVVPQAPEVLWPQVKAFWEQRGFTLDVEDAKVGVMETNWAENRAKLPNDAVRNTIGRLLQNLYDTGERDRFRTRIERTAAGSEIYISHRGAEEAFADDRRETTQWRARPSDPQLEAEFLSRLMVALGSPPETARAAVSAAAGPAAPGTAPATTAAAGAAVRTAPGPTATSLTIEEPFDRAWRRVGVALDRGGFTVEDRDRAAGLYYVRYVDPKSVGQEEPGFFSRLFSWFGKSPSPTTGAQRYRIAVKAGGERTTVSVQKTTGEPELGENAQRIIALLQGELR
jgi:outer membrane protein assembly factor BamC